MISNFATVYNYYFDKFFMFVFGFDPNTPLGTLVVFVSIFVCFGVANICDYIIAKCDEKIAIHKQQN